MSAPIGLIAGNRDLPLMVAAKARELGRPLVAAGIDGEAAPELAGLADRFQLFTLGQAGPVLDYFAAAGVRDVVMIGGISRETLVLNYEPDAVALEVLETLEDFHTDRILRAVAGLLESRGLALRSVAELLPELLTPPGFLTQKIPDDGLMADLRIAWRVAKELGRLDIGQCAVVSGKITMAAEAAEGTDAAVLRGAALAGEGQPVAVAKVVKPTQDVRLDPPVIGPETIRVMAQAGVNALAVDAGAVLIINREECVRLADEAGLALLACTDDFLL
ncbi:MAG: UDP-2,3-diacylglucosamine diphosphatase LpxI [Candidatus Adiutrix sp.]|nr:UDP-2,3-diacylglucosamine diphosphatase LpxI [Candidatus Adiutrix sp.]